MRANSARSSRINFGDLVQTPDRPVAMVDVSGSSAVLSFAGETRCCAFRASGSLHTDERGSVIAMGDASGNRVEGPYTYDVYGNGAPASGVPYKYTGRRLDAGEAEA